MPAVFLNDDDEDWEDGAERPEPFHFDYGEQDPADLAVPQSVVPALQCVGGVFLVVFF